MARKRREPRGSFAAGLTALISPFTLHSLVYGF